ncbi:hypothetical protein C8J56DRAFT_891158 [Mycena floridula]|nr:hypothetical protein C8J56DRAFT_891158 [Mycena floridula]
MSLFQYHRSCFQLVLASRIGSYIFHWSPSSQALHFLSRRDMREESSSPGLVSESLTLVLAISRRQKGHACAPLSSAIASVLDLSLHFEDLLVMTIFQSFHVVPELCWHESPQYTGNAKGMLISTTIPRCLDDAPPMRPICKPSALLQDRIHSRSTLLSCLHDNSIWPPGPGGERYWPRELRKPTKQQLFLSEDETRTWHRYSGRAFLGTVEVSKIRCGRISLGCSLLLGMYMKKPAHRHPCFLIFCAALPKPIMTFACEPSYLWSTLTIKPSQKVVAPSSYRLELGTAGKAVGLLCFSTRCGIWSEFPSLECQRLEDIQANRTIRSQFALRICNVEPEYVRLHNFSEPITALRTFFPTHSKRMESRRKGAYCEGEGCADGLTRELGECVVGVGVGGVEEDLNQKEAIFVWVTL